MSGRLAKFVALIFSTVMLASDYAMANSDYRILGSDKTFPKGHYKVLLDAEMSGLRIRHVAGKCPKGSSGRWDHLELDGDIGPDSTRAVGLLLPKMRKCVNKVGNTTTTAQVYMNSGGGLLVDGFELGKLFRANQVLAVITGGQVCASACATAFMGGHVRLMENDAKLMFHAPYLQIDSRSIDCSDRGQVGDLKSYFSDMLDEVAGTFLHKRTMDYCSQSDGWVLNADAAKLFGLANTITSQNLDNATFISLGSLTEDAILAMREAPVLRVSDGAITEFHYCNTGQFADEFLVLYFAEDRLIAKKRYDLREAAFGPCEVNVQQGDYVNVPKQVVEKRRALM